MLRTQAGTHGYMAPEVLGLLDDDDNDDDDSDDGVSDEDARPSYSKAVDIWALGVIAFYMLTGRLPFPASNVRPLRRYVRGKTPFPIEALQDKNISDAGCTWIKTCMAPSPHDRPTAGFSRQHQWLMGAGRLEASTGDSMYSIMLKSRDSVVLGTSNSTATASWKAADSVLETENNHTAFENKQDYSTANDTSSSNVSVPFAVHQATSTDRIVSATS